MGLGRVVRHVVLVLGLLLALACAGLPVGLPGTTPSGATPAATAPVDGAAVAVETPVPSPWNFGLVMSILALLLGGASAMLGIWVGRDPDRPIIFALAMTLLIGSAVVVGILQGYLDSAQAVQRQADLDRMLNMVDEIAQTSGDPELAKLSAEHGKKGKKR
jgi:hypothetical protein